MTSERELLAATAEAIFAKGCTPETIDAAGEQGWDPALWRTVEQAGFTTLSVDEGDLLDAATVIRIAAAHSAMVPLAETMLGGWLANRIGIERPEGPLTAGVDSQRMPFGRFATAIVIDGGHAITTRTTTSTSTNLAREPRDEMRLDGPAEHVAIDEKVRGELALRAALFRTVQLAGAGERALELTVRYVRERVAFGRPISQFQAVQQQVAQLAAEVALMRVSADAAVLACVIDGVEESAFQVAAAMATSAESAGTVAKIAHQMHGAIGFTYEHVLRNSTLRLWSWRDEAGGESLWAGVVGARAREARGAGLWRVIAGL